MQFFIQLGVRNRSTHILALTRALIFSNIIINIYIYVITQAHAHSRRSCNRRPRSVASPNGVRCMCALCTVRDVIIFASTAQIMWSESIDDLLFTWLLPVLSECLGWTVIVDGKHERKSDEEKKRNTIHARYNSSAEPVVCKHDVNIDKKCCCHC